MKEILLLPNTNDIVFHQLYGFGKVYVPFRHSMDCYVKFEDFAKMRIVPSLSLFQL